jgi:hypothetical protein
MTEDSLEETSEVEVTVGQTSVRIEGSESFIERELPAILDWVDSTDGSTEKARGTQEPESESSGVTTQPSLSEAVSEDQSESSDEEAESKLAEIARNLNVDPDKLSKHFYIDEDENSIHIQNPMEIEAKYALLGYCDLREHLTGDTYHDNNKTKKKLIDQEKVDIQRWGSSLLYNLRRNGLVKDDPNADRERNKPFKITPKGHEEFVQWVNETE